MQKLLTEITNTEIKLTEMNKVSQKINELNIDISKFQIMIYYYSLAIEYMKK